LKKKSLGNQLKMARDQKLMKSSSFEGIDTCQLTSVLPPSFFLKNAFKASFRIKPAIAKWG